MRCVVTNRPDEITLHHCHGGSIKEAGWHVGMGQKQNPFLQIPLNVGWHVGRFGIDSGMGVITWEQTFGTQIEHLDTVNEQLSYDLWEQAEAWEKKNRGLFAP